MGLGGGSLQKLVLVFLGWLCGLVRRVICKFSRGCGLGKRVLTNRGFLNKIGIGDRGVQGSCKG